MHLNEEGFVRLSGEMKTLLKNGYLLMIDFCKDEDGYFDDREYWITEDGLKEVHNCFAKFINDFGLPRTGDFICDKADRYKIAQIEVDYSNEVPEIQIVST